MTQLVPAEPVPAGWLVLVYRVPPEPSSSRVGIWRDLKRIGALYLQQCVCIVPDHPDLRDAFVAVRERVTRAGGSSNLFPVPDLPPDDAAALVSGFRALAVEQYAEIVEECETKFVKEIEFEHFRQNYTFAEAEEIEQDLEKIRRWYARVRARDWFDAPGREEVEAWLTRCAALLDEFFATVHAQVAGQDGTATADLPATTRPGPRVRLAPVREGGPRRPSRSHPSSQPPPAPAPPRDREA